MATEVLKLGLIGGLGVLFLYRDMLGVVRQRIDEQFKSERISKTVDQVASQQARDLMATKVQPMLDLLRTEAITKTHAYVEELSRSERDLNARLLAVDETVRRLEVGHTQAQQAISNLKASAQAEQQKGRIQVLEASAAIGDRKAFNQLLSIERTSSGEDQKLASSAVVRLTTFYNTMTRIATTHLERNGTEVADHDIPVCDGITQLRSNSDWKVRAVAARALRHKRDKAAIAALVGAVEHDASLDVVRESMVSLRLLIPGMTGIGLLDTETAIIRSKASNLDAFADSTCTLQSPPASNRMARYDLVKPLPRPLRLVR